MKDPAEVKLFEMYLENEKVRETQTSREIEICTVYYFAFVGIERALLNSSTITAFQTRVILRDRIVVINKLPYIQQIDTVAESVNISKTDTDLLYEKARALIECYLQSDIPPRVQVNVPSDLALTTTNNLSLTGPDRGLFHEAAISVFPLLYHFWRNFQLEWLKGHKPSALLAKIEAKIKTKRPVTPHRGKPLPTYVNVRLSQCNVVAGPILQLLDAEL
ncbi:hypothetical protein KUTeg_011835 [Tegillarca granosa]|uniref:Uncharacterized protein n=1 Tax=Tegillarca granosa TaxID=220873 RepID=A0ABQ9F1F3_TEGGR|nr:hypothetical protein KUTeg_011835 [Tegillarca granosa]